MTSKHMRRYSKSLAIREMQIKTTTRITEVGVGYERVAEGILMVIGFFCILTMYGYTFLNKHIHIQLLS